MCSRDIYHQYEPHEHFKHAVLEDVEIGRYFKKQGVIPHIANFQSHIGVWMYASLREAWHGFKKNAYLMAGGKVIPFLVIFSLFVWCYWIAPWVSLWFLAALYVVKGLSDRYIQMPWWVTLLIPVTFVLSGLLQLSSAIGFWTGHVDWKGRNVD